MDEIGMTSHGSLIPYERGLPVSRTVRATLRYFAPGAAISLAAGLTLLVGGLPVGGEWLESLAVIGGGIGVMSLGFLAGLEGLRRWLYPDARVDGRRSFVAGLLSPLAVFITGVFSAPTAMGPFLALVLFMPALVLAFLMFFAWLSPTPEEMRGDG